MATEAVAAASPALAVVARRASREATPVKHKVAASDDDDDDADWMRTSEVSSDEGNEAGEDGGVVRGRVRLHAVKKRVSGGVEADDDQRKNLADKRWARRSVVMHGLGPSGAD